MIKREFSAGGIVYKRITNHESRITNKRVLWLVAQHSQHKGWIFPKGLIGDEKEGESSEETAIREVKEETGIEAKIIKKLEKPAVYFYTFKGEKVVKTVYYFLMEYISGDIKDHDWEMSQVKWLKTNEVKERLSYQSDKEAFEQALKAFERIKN